MSAPTASDRTSAGLSPTQRRALIGALALVTLVVNYALYRGKPQLDRLRATTSELDGLVATRAKLRASAGPGPNALRLGLERARRELEALGARVAQEHARFAAPEQATELTVQVSALASASGLRVETEEAIPVAAAPARARAAQPAPEPAPDLRLALGAEPFQRPLRAWTLRGGFPALWTFLTELSDLPWRVVVVRLEVAREDDDPTGELAVRMTVAL